MYLVVGYYIIVDAEIVKRAACVLDISARLDLPVIVTLTAVDILPLSGIANLDTESGNGY